MEGNLSSKENYVCLKILISIGAGKVTLIKKILFKLTDSVSKAVQLIIEKLQFYTVIATIPIEEINWKDYALFLPISATKNENNNLMDLEKTLKDYNMLD